MCVNALKLFNIAITVTPTSAITALSIPVTPNAPSDKNVSFIIADKIIFCQTIFRVYFEISIACGIFEILSFEITMSLASILAEFPIAS